MLEYIYLMSFLYINNNKKINKKYLNSIKIYHIQFMNINGDWGLGIGDWGLGIGANAQSQILNAQSPITIEYDKIF